MAKETIKIEGRATKEQIAALKAKHGEVFAYEVGDLVGYLSRPGRQAISAASVIGKDDPLKFAEVIIDNCWLGGHEILRTETKYFMGLSQRVTDLVEIVTGKLKKL